MPNENPNEGRTDWRQYDVEKAKSAEVIARLEAAIVAAPTIVSQPYKGTERRKNPRLTRRETLAKCLVNLKTALAALESTGSLAASAKIWWIEGIDAECVLKYDGFYDVDEHVKIGTQKTLDHLALSGRQHVHVLAPPVSRSAA